MDNYDTPGPLLRTFFYVLKLFDIILFTYVEYIKKTFTRYSGKCIYLFSTLYYTVFKPLRYPIRQNQVNISKK